MATISAPMTDVFFDIIKARRTHYSLTAGSPIPDAEVEETVKNCLLHCPSSFNWKSAGCVILFKKDHEKLWVRLPFTLSGGVRCHLSLSSLAHVDIGD